MKAQSLKRLLSGLLAALMLCTLLPTSAWAATSLSSAPYAEVEYGYSADVTVGTIRYISQLTGNAYFNWDYWPGSAFGGYSSPGSECGTASISMALSYIGINKTPADILYAHNGYTYFDGWGVSMSRPSVSTGMDNYINGNGKYSPVIIHLPGYSSNGHFVVLAGRVSGSVYQVIDPANSNVWNITINGTSASYNGRSDTVDGVYQYYNPNASLPIPEPEIPSGSCGNNLTWTLEDGTLTISGSGKMWDWDANNGKKASWYSYADSIDYVSLGSGVTSIGDYAFWGCNNLTSIIIPYGVTSIGKSAFDGCFALSDISLPSSVSSIGRWAFAFCTSLTAIRIPDGVSTINAYTFCDCGSLSSISLSDSLMNIGDSAFSGCSNLTDVYYAGSKSQWNEISIGESDNEYLFNATIHFARADAPAAPNLSSSIVSSSGAIKLSWNSVSGASKYYLYRCTDGSSYRYYGSTTKTTYTNSSVTPGTTYYYKVVAVTADGTKSAYSNRTYRTADCAAPKLSIQLSGGKPQLKWSAVEGAKEYVIYRSGYRDGTYTKMYTTTKTSYTNTGAKAGYTYYYKVVAVCKLSSYGNSAYSNVVSIKCK